jgi:hypothetical protein
MGLIIKQGAGPFVIDRALPKGIFQRASGVVELVSESDGQPKRFDTADEAVMFLHENDADTESYDWTIFSDSGGGES